MVFEWDLVEVLVLDQRQLVMGLMIGLVSSLRSNIGKIKLVYYWNKIWGYRNGSFVSFTA